MESVEACRVADELVELELPFQIKVGQHREVLARPSTAGADTEQVLVLVQRLERVGHFGGQVGHSHSADVPAGASHLQAIGEELGGAHHFESMVDSSSHLLDLTDHVNPLVGQDEVGSAEVDGESLLFRDSVHSDDLTRPAEPGRLDDIETDTARTDDHTRIAELQAGPVEHCARAGDHPAADQRRGGERHLRRYRDALVLAHDRLLDEGPYTSEVVERLVAFTVGLGEVAHGHAAVAGVASLTVTAVPAIAEGRQDDVVADRAVGDGRPSLHDNARGFMARHERSGHVVLAVHATQIGSANPGGFDFDPHLAWCQIGVGEFDGVGQPHRVFGGSFENQSLHPVSVAHTVAELGMRTRPIQC